MRENAVDILGIGAQKSATSWAAHVLNLHSNIWIPKRNAYSGKEVMFWDNHYNKGLQWYKAIMSPPEPQLKSMDVSPGYSRIGRNKVVQCRNLSPSARVFMLLRNPIYRDWSSLVMEATLRLKVDLASASFIDLMVYYDRTNVAQYTTYARTVKLWKEHYGDQFFVGLYDDVAQSPQEFYRTLCNHCGLDPEAVPNWRARVQKTVFKGPDISLPPQMHEFLSKKYDPMIRELEHLLGRDLSDWRNPDPAVK